METGREYLVMWKLLLQSGPLIKKKLLGHTPLEKANRNEYTYDFDYLQAASKRDEEYRLESILTKKILEPIWSRKNERFWELINRC